MFGGRGVTGLLAGAIVSGVQVAISASNTGGAWDNCKKEIGGIFPAQELVKDELNENQARQIISKPCVTI